MRSDLPYLGGIFIGLEISFRGVRSYLVLEYMQCSICSNILMEIFHKEFAVLGGGGFYFFLQGVAGHCLAAHVDVGVVEAVFVDVVLDVADWVFILLLV